MSISSLSAEDFSGDIVGRNYRVLQPGRIIDGAYRVEEFISSGRQGEVYRCSHINLEGLQFALKVIYYDRLRESSGSTAFLRFRKEARIALGINHPNVIRSYAFIQEDDFFGLLMEYSSCGDLADFLETNGGVSIEQGIEFLLQACSGLEAIHQAGIVHRDVKTKNFLFSNSGELQIIDFGVARLDDGQKLTPRGSILGTMEYLSPEYLSTGDCDARSDIYSLGLVAYEMFTGKEAFTAGTVIENVRRKMEFKVEAPHRLRADCPPQLSEIILKALEPNPEDRFKDISEMYAAIAKVRDSLYGVGEKKKKKQSHSSTTLIESYGEEQKAVSEEAIENSSSVGTQEVEVEEQTVSSECLVLRIPGPALKTLCLIAFFCYMLWRDLPF